MTVIRPNSVSGITSITAQANEINFFRSNGTLAGLQLNGVNFNTTAGISTLAALKITGNLDVEGVLTYQDVTNVDSVGIITARSTIDAQGDVSIADKIIHTGDTNTAIRFPAADTFTVETAGTERLRIADDGELTSTATQADVATFTSNQSASTIYVKDTDGDGIFISGSSAYGHRIYTNTTESLKLGTNSTERLRITDNGQLNTYTTGTITADFNTSNGAGSYLQFDTGASGANIGYIGAGSQLVTGSSTNDLGFRSANHMVFSTGGSVERFRINSNGQIYCTTTTTIALDLNTTSSSGAYIQLDTGVSGANIGYIGAGSQLVTGSATNDLGFRTPANMVFSTGGSTERFRIDSGGSVLVGGTSLGAAGSFGMEQTGHVRSVLASGNAGDTLFGAISGVSNGFQINIDSSNNQEYRFHDGSQQRVTIKSGKMGIGETNPISALTINEGSKGSNTTFTTAEILRLEGYDSTNSRHGIGFGRYNGGANGYKPAAFIGAATGTWSSYTNCHLIFATRNTTGDDEPTERLRITNSGNTRIGVPPTTGSSSLIDEKQATIGTKHFYTVYHNFSQTNSPLAVNSKIPHPACGTVEIMAGWANGNGMTYKKFYWASSGNVSGCSQLFSTGASRYGVSTSVGTPTMSISGDYTNFSFTFSDGQGAKMEKLKIHFEYFNQFRIDG